MKKIFLSEIKDLNHKLIYVIIILTIQIVLFLTVRDIQNNLRPRLSNIFFNSFPSLALAFGFSHIAWIFQRKKFYKALLFSLLISISHEILRLIDNGIPIDVVDLIFIIIGLLLAILFHYFICILFLRKESILKN